MIINYNEIKEKADNDLSSLTVKEATIWDWVQCFEDGTIDFNGKLEEEDCFSDCTEQILIWRLRYERDYYANANKKNIRSLIDFKKRYNDFISVCHDILGVGQITESLYDITGQLNKNARY